MEFDTNWRIESKDILFKLTKGYLKSISSHIEKLFRWLYGLILNNYPVTYSFIGIFFSCGMIMLHGIWYKLEEWIKRYLIQTYHRLSQEYFKSFRIAFRVALWLDFEQLSNYLFVYRFEGGFMARFWTIIQLFIHFTVSFSSSDIKMLHGIWYKIGGLNQEISYSNLPQVISRVFQVI